jgi:cell division cycle 14
MRIVRPGSVVGPQQQYMYLKQLEWVKWAAADEVRKLQTPTTDAAPLVTPATPPAESDDADAMEDVQLTPTTHVPPVTPSRHIAAAAARTRAIATPGQPRKTPTAKRVHTLETDEEDSKDVLPALGIPPVRRVTRTAVRGVGMSESRPVRVTRSTAVANAIKRSTSPSASTPQLETPTKKPPPNKVPRLGTRAAAAARAAVGGTTDGSPRTRQMPSGPSRLPMLAPSKRPLRHQVTASMEVPRRLDEVVPMRKMDNTADDAWMTNNTESVVVPASKSARPGLRPIRRRRSSFSAADVEA